MAHMNTLNKPGYCLQVTWPRSYRMGQIPGSAARHVQVSPDGQPYRSESAKRLCVGVCVVLRTGRKEGRGEKRRSGQHLPLHTDSGSAARSISSQPYTHLAVPMPGGQGLSPFLSTSPSFRFPFPPSTTSRSQEALTPPAWHPASNHPVAHSPWLGTSNTKTGQ